jgi:hypothetical protein
MAREHGRLLCRIWNDSDWKALTSTEQWAYEMLVSQANITNCGLILLTVRRWANHASDMTEEKIRDALRTLDRKRFIAMDEDTEEILVRTFIRGDGVLKLPNVFKNALRQASQIQSSRLRNVLAAELRKLDRPDAGAVADQIEDPQVPLVPEPIAEPVGEPIPHGFQKTCGEGKGKGSSSPPSPSKSGPVSSRNAARGSRGSRIPDDFAVAAEMVQWARENTPDVDGREETQAFMDYWRAKPGKDGVKTDWVATWRNWMRKAQKDAQRASARASPNGFQSSTDANIAALLGDTTVPALRLLPPGGEPR